MLISRKDIYCVASWSHTDIILQLINQYWQIVDDCMDCGMDSKLPRVAMCSYYLTTVEVILSTCELAGAFKIDINSRDRIIRRINDMQAGLHIDN